MISPTAGVAFTWSDDGDMRADLSRRGAVSQELGLVDQWATVDQVHGAESVFVTASGTGGVGDVVATTTPGLPVAVFVADCLGVVLCGSGTVAVAHAGWRGLLAGVLDEARAVMASHGSAPERAYIGPGIGACCYEVGVEVAELFPEDVSTTTWGTTSVNLTAFATRHLSELEVWTDGRCTNCGGGLSHRRDGTAHRMAAVGWLA